MWKPLALAAALVISAHGAEATAPPLVDADWVRQHLHSDDLVILDVRNAIDGGSREVFEKGHLPGAVYSNYAEAGWRTTRDGVPGMLPPVADLEKLIGALGIDNDDHVVVVAAGTSALDMGSATRVYWTFKVLGHDRVSVLDGGHKAYAERYSLEEGWTVPEATDFAGELRTDLLASREEVAAALGSKTMSFIDNRPPAQHLGKKKHPAAARPGTIPGAGNVPESSLTVDGGTFAKAEVVRELLQKAGANGSGEEQITFCNTGHWASLGWFASSELLGNDKVKLYDGSMVDWSRMKALPVSVAGEED